MFEKLTGIWRYLVPGIAILLLVALIVFGVRSCANDERSENNQFINTGELIERGAASEEVIKHVENARDAAANPTQPELNVVCQKYDRNCQDRK